MPDHPSRLWERTTPRAARLQAIVAQRDSIAHTWEQTHASYGALRAERDDAALATAQAHAERALGVPVPALSVLEARLDVCQAAVQAVETELAQLNALYDIFTERIRALGAPDEGQGLRHASSDRDW